MTKPRTIPREIFIAANPAELAARAAELAREAREVIARKGRFDVALSGGGTPRATYEAIAKQAIDWKQVHLFWGDERIVPMNDPESNYRMARETLLDRIEIPADNVHRVPTELNDPRGIAQSYELLLRRHFQHERPRGAKVPEYPRFDFVFLGVGDDGHTASLFPEGSPGEDGPAWVIAPFAAKLRKFRISLTFPVLNAASLVVFLVAEGSKAGIMSRILARRASELPSARVHPDQGRLLFLLDQAAAAEVSESVLEAGRAYHVDRQATRRAAS